MRILLGVPSSGTLTEGAARLSYQASLRHEVHRLPSCMSGGNFNSILGTALNAGRAGAFDFLAMHHADTTVVDEEPGLRWADIMVEEAIKHDADFISCPNAIKDHFGITSSGIGDPANRWNPHRRFCINEFRPLPVTFSAADAGYPDKFLLHNHALCLWDLRKPVWYELDSEGQVRVLFNFIEKLQFENGQYVRYQESDDWYFSRKLWEVGARTFITTRLTLRHLGAIEYENKGDEGLWQNGDEGTAANWRTELTVGAGA